MLHVNLRPCRSFATATLFAGLALVWMVHRFNDRLLLYFTATMKAPVVNEHGAFFVKSCMNSTETDDAQRYLLKGLSRAASYNSTRCLLARNEARMESWTRMCVGGEDGVGPIIGQQVVAGNVDARHGDLHPCLARGRNRTKFDDLFIYVRNQKAASTAAIEATRMVLKGKLRAYHFCFRRSPLANRCLPKFSYNLGRRIAFTMVDDPIRVFVSGFVEIVCRVEYFVDALRGPNPGSSVYIASFLDRSGWRNISANSAGRLFRAFLDDVENRRELGRDAFHVWPQALKIDVGETPSFVGDVGTFAKSFSAMLPGMDIPLNTFEQRVQNRATHGNACKKSISAKLKITAEDKQRICLLLLVDYMCFEMPLPPECTRF